MMYYAVRAGFEPGIYHNWADCEKQVKGFKKPEFKKFKTEEEAIAFMNLEASKCAHLSSHSLKLDGLVAYVDGSCNNKHRVAGYGIVFVLKGERLFRLSGGFSVGESGGANVSGELMAAMKAVEHARLNGYYDLVIGYDYSGIASFANGDYEPKTEIAKEYVRFMTKAQETMVISFLKIEGHNGHNWNEEADKLAACGVKQFIGESCEPLLKKLNQNHPLL